MAGNDNGEQARIVSKSIKDIDFTGFLNTHLGHDGFQRISIAYTMPDALQSEIDQIKNAEYLSKEEKQLYIEKKLLNETDCHGYFFEQMPSMRYRHLCLEKFDENLDKYIRKEAIQNNFQWTLLQDLCCQLVDSITWLHQSNIYYNGRLHPRNIFVKKTVLDGRTIIKLGVPEKINPFDNLDNFYSSFWSMPEPQNQEIDQRQQEQYRIKRDMASIVFLVYFIQSAGYHLFQVFGKRQDEDKHPNWPKDPNEETYTKLITNIRSNNKDLGGLEEICFCTGLENPDDACRNEMQCKQRFWINSLAKDWINCILDELFEGETAHYTTYPGILKKHPFFWKVREILNFIERSSNYLKESGMEKVPEEFQKSPESTLSVLESNYPDIIKYLQEPDPKIKKKTSRIGIQDLRTLLYQIRNKSSHWDEEKSSYKKGAIAELEAINFAAPPDNEMKTFPHKYCLFWMCNFPTLLLEIWKKFKDDVNY